MKMKNDKTEYIVEEENKLEISTNFLKLEFLSQETIN